MTNNNVKGATGIRFDYNLVSINGGKPPIDKDSLDFIDTINKKFRDNVDFQAKLKNTLCLDDVNSADYDAIFFADGHDEIIVMQ